MTTKEKRPIPDAGQLLSVEGLMDRIPIFQIEEDRLLVKHCLLRLRTPEIKEALETHQSVEQSLLFLAYKYQDLLSKAQRAYRSHVAIEKNKLFESSGLAIAKAEARVESAPTTKELLEHAQTVEAQHEFIRNLGFAARNRLRAIEHLANYERLEHKLDSTTPY